MPKYSIIIPTLNEQEFLPRILDSLNGFDEDFEVIVADGGSKDDTINIARKHSVILCSSEKGKGLQLIKGVEGSSGDILVFIHADTFLPKNAFKLINEYMINRGCEIATFRMKFDDKGLLFKIYSWFTRFDSVFTTFGDQGVIITKNFYEEIGGFPEFSIFEDVELLRKARKKTRIVKLPACVTTSARRLKKNGVVLTQLLNAIYILRYFSGTEPSKIYDKYFK
ncbi:MAG: TIGR04283 family arsenosugar biosynthesis glycosyltransferase [Ignavibacterium sp.]|nr:MAG: TIGR04283 family arsenosugar biosynthesis glycosyltransferase [Ignavibacterium sp.]